MRSMFKTGIFVLMLAIAPIAAQAGTLEGVAIGAGTGAVIAGPPGAVARRRDWRRGWRPEHCWAPPSPLLDQR